MSWLLNLVYLALITVASPWLIYQSWRTGKYREGFRAKFFGDVPTRTSMQPCVWLHAVSVGEVNLLGGIISELSRRRPDLEFVVTTTTQTGYALAKKKYPDQIVCYCPLDFSWAVKNTLSKLRPDLIVLAELELWPNLIASAYDLGVPVVVMNGRLSEASFRGYRRIRPFVKRVLGKLSIIASQNTEYAERFIALGAPRQNVSVTGSIKFDNANTDRDNPQTNDLRDLVGLNSQHSVFLAGSTQDPEEALALTTYLELCQKHPSLRLIVVPRHPERFDAVDRVLANASCRYIRRSQIAERVSGDDWQVLLVDTVGELGAWWGTADVAYVGGSMGDRGGQNMIEPAAYGAAVCFGPNTRNFRDVVAMLLANSSAQVVNDGDELTAFLDKSLTDRPFAQAMGERASSLVSQQRGATLRTTDVLESYLPPRRRKPNAA